MKIAIVAGGPKEELPLLDAYQSNIDFWIGADDGALALLEQNIPIDLAIGDFDSVSNSDLERIKRLSNHCKVYPIEKDETDLELALDEALNLDPEMLYLFGVTAGRLDHELVNIQQLYRLLMKQVEAFIIDKHHEISMYKPGSYEVEQSDCFPYISFIPFSPIVKELTLKGFYYPLNRSDITWGSTLCMSNQILQDPSTFSFTDGILLMIKSKDKQ